MVTISQAEFLGEEEAIQPVSIEQPTSQNKLRENPLNMTASEFLGGGDFEIPQTLDKSFLERFQEDIDKRVKMSTMIINATEAGEQSFAEGVWQVGGKVGAGAIFDFIGEVLVSGGRGLSAITPDVIEKPMVDRIVAAGHAFLNTDIGKAGLEAASLGAGYWEDFKNRNPRSARNIEALVNISLLAMPVKAKLQVPPVSSPLGKLGTRITQAGRAQKIAEKKKFAEGLVLPKSTAPFRTEQVARTEVGILGTKAPQLSLMEKEMADTVADISDVAVNKTLQGNYNAISKEVGKEATTLKTALRDNQVIFPRREFSKKLDDALVRLGDNPLIVGDAEKVAKRIVLKMNQITDAKPSTGSGILAARKELDAWALSLKGPNIFDPKLENAMSIALREIRQTTNNFLAHKATNVAVKESLKKQSTLLRAMDNIAPKAAEEASNVVIRTWQNISRILPLRGEFNQSMAVLFGVGGLGASALFAPFFTKIALGAVGTYATGKFLMGSMVKRGLGRLIRETDKAIKLATNPDMIRQLRADRALLVELSKGQTDD